MTNYTICTTVTNAMHILINDVATPTEIAQALETVQTAITNDADAVVTAKAKEFMNIYPEYIKDKNSTSKNNALYYGYYLKQHLQHVVMYLEVQSNLIE